MLPSEHRVMILASQGKSTKEISKALGISPQVVSNHLSNIYLELGIEGRSELPYYLSVNKVPVPNVREKGFSSFQEDFDNLIAKHPDLSIAQQVARLGCSKSTVIRLRNKAKINT